MAQIHRAIGLKQESFMSLFEPWKTMGVQLWMYVAVFAWQSVGCEKLRPKMSSRQELSVRDCLHEMGGGCLACAVYPPRQVTRKDVIGGICHTHVI